MKNKSVADKLNRRYFASKFKARGFYARLIGLAAEIKDVCRR